MKLNELIKKIPQNSLLEVVDEDYRRAWYGEPYELGKFELNYFKGYAFKSGSVNTLIKKGLVKADEEVTYDCDVVYNGVKVGSVKKTAQVYELVSND